MFAMFVFFFLLLILSLSLLVSGQIARYNARNPFAGDPYDSRVDCKGIADDYLNLIAQHEIVEKILSREKQEGEQDLEIQEGFFEEEGRKFMTMQLMKEMRQVREMILNATLEPYTHATTPQQELDMRVHGAVDQIYHQLRDLKIAEWNQETENEEFHWDVVPMKQLGYRLDVSFMALVYRCLLLVPEKTLDSSTCDIIAGAYTDEVLNDEIIDFANVQKGLEQQGVVTNTDDVPLWDHTSKREYEARQVFKTTLIKQMKEARDNMSNAYFNKNNGNA